MENDIYLYLNSVEYAKEHQDLVLWRESWRANIACKEAIEEAIRRDFNGMYLLHDCAKSVIDQYGFKRVNYVLASTVQELSYDGRLSRENKAWAQGYCIHKDKEHNSQFTVSSHPAVLDGFIHEARLEYEKLGLFGGEQCMADSGQMDYTGHVLVLSPDILKESYWTAENQLWYAHDGFGCGPKAVGRSIRATCLGDGEETIWYRHDFIGVLKEELLPDWAREKLEALQQSDTPQMDDMRMT